MTINSTSHDQPKKFASFFTNSLKGQQNDFILRSNVTITTPILYSVGIKPSSSVAIKDQLFSYRNKNIKHCASFLYSCAICGVAKKQRQMTTYSVHLKHGVIQYKCCAGCLTGIIK